MRTPFLKKAVCACAALTLAFNLAACGAVENTETETGSGTSTTAANSTEPDTTTSQTSQNPEPVPVLELSAKPLSTAEFKQVGSTAGEAYISAAANFSVEMLKNACLDDINAGRSVLISPESILMAMGMTANGAKGETLTQMLDTLCGGLSLDEQNQTLNYLLARAKGSEDITFNIANSLWVRDDSERLKIKPEFADTLQSLYNAPMYLEPFDEGTVGDINAWVNSNTNGMIPSVLDSIDEETVSYIINAIAFEAEWQKEYLDTQVHEDSTFTNSSGAEESCTMLHSEEHTYFSDDSACGFVKNYKGGEYALMAILPNEDTTVADYVADLDGEKLAALWNDRDYREVIAEIPEFSYDYESKLKDPLMAMGMTDAFDKEQADFTPMADTGTENLFISSVLHKTHIELDRKGTKAAAATAVTMLTNEAEAEVPEFVILDRPFVYAIVDTENGMPVFLGVVNSVNE